MDSSLRLVPAAGGPSKTSVKDTANELGLHDTLRNGSRSLSNEVKGGSVIQQRLERWEETQDNLKMTMQRSLFGLHLPVRQMMERKLVAANPHMPALAQSQSNIHLDILMGRDEALDVADIFGDQDTRTPLDIHSEMERKRRI